MSVDKTLKNRLSLNRPSNIRKSNKTPVSKIVTESIKNPPPKPSESEIFKRELEEIAKRAEMMRILEEEEKLIQKKSDDEKLQEKLVSPFTGKKQVDMKPSLEYAIEELLPKAQIPEQIEYPEPFQEEPALNRELAEFKRKINQHLHQVGFMGSGGGGIGDIKDAGDIDGGTALVNGKFLKFDSSTQKFVGSDASVSDETIQDIVGAMVSSNTESGITVAYQDADGTLDFTIGTLNQDTSGNAATATALETARTIGGVSFDGTGNINLPGVNTAGNQDTSGTAAIATTVTITDNESTNENNAIIFTAGGAQTGGNLGLESDGTLTYNPSTGKVTATGFVGALTGNVTGNADTATALATARNIAGVSFDGTANISLALTNLGISDGSDGQFLKTDGAGNFSFAAASVSSLAADDIDSGDAAVNITTSSGNITIDAAANNTDIIFKGTDDSSDITMLTLDGSDAGTASFNHDVKLSSDASVLGFGADNDITLTHVHDTGIRLSDSMALLLGTGDDISFSWDGTDGHLAVAGTLNVEGSGETLAKFIDDGAVELYHNNSKKFETTSAGVTVTGTVTATAGSTLLIKNSSGSTVKTVKGIS